MQGKVMFKRAATLLLISFLLLVLSCPSTPEQANVQPVVNAANFFRDNGIKTGINIGNSLDAYGSGVSSETKWGNPSLNQNLFNGIKAAGFDIVRIPVTWMGHIGPAPDYTIDPDFLNRVAEIVGYAHNAGLFTIINLHNDGSTANTTQEDGWLSINKALAGQESDITAKFGTIWEQIAVKFRDEGEYLMFEAFNELHDGNGYTAGREVPADQIALLNKWTQVFTDSVRKEGGENASRFLIIPAYCSGPEALYSGGFTLPNDSVPGKQIVTFHYYRPENFALYGNLAVWGTSDEKAAIDTLFSTIKEYYTDKNIPVIIGETGPVRNVSPSGDQNRLAYISYMFGAAKNNGFVPVYWDNGSFNRNGNGFGLFNRTTGKPQTDEFDLVIHSMISATGTGNDNTARVR